MMATERSPTAAKIIVPGESFLLGVLLYFYRAAMCLKQKVHVCTGTQVYIATRPPKMMSLIVKSHETRTEYKKRCCCPIVQHAVFCYDAAGGIIHTLFTFLLRLYRRHRSKLWEEAS